MLLYSLLIIANYCKYFFYVNVAPKTQITTTHNYKK